MCVCMFIEYCDFSTGSLYAQEERQNSLKGRLHFFKINTTPFEGMPHVFIDAGPEDCFLIATLRIFKINWLCGDTISQSFWFLQNPS